MTTYADSFKQVSTPYVETSLNAVQTYKFGGRIPAGSEVLDISLQVEVNASEILGQTYPDIAAGNYPVNQIKESATLVNLIPIYGMYGKAAHTIANQKQTITNFGVTEGIKPHYSYAEEIGSLKGKFVHGVMKHDLALNYVMGSIVTYDALSKGKKQDLQTWEPTTPIFPSGISSEFDVFNHFKWGADGSEAALDGMLSVQLRGTQNVITTISDEGYFKTVTGWAPIFTGFNISFSKENSALYEDAYARTKRSILWKMSKSSAESGNSHWFEFDTVGATALCNSLTAIKKSGNIIGWNAIFTCEDITCVGQDYVADTFYAIP